MHCNSLSDDFKPSFTKPQNSPLSFNAAVAIGHILCSHDNIQLVIQVEFPHNFINITNKLRLPLTAIDSSNLIPRKGRKTCNLVVDKNNFVKTRIWRYR